MPMLYTGKFRGYVEHTEVKQIDYGPLGVTTIGLIRPQNPDPEKMKKIEERLAKLAGQVALRVMHEETEAAEAAERAKALPG